MSILSRIIRNLFKAPFKGWSGERLTSLRLQVALNSEVYKRIDNSIIPSKNGTAQIDHILVSPYGVFIIETKNISGWIFGAEDQSKWTKCVYGKKYTFQNPLKQVYRQKKVLSEFLNIEERVIHTVINFVGNCGFKTSMPDNVINSGLSSYIKSYQVQLLSQADIYRILNEFELLKLNPMLTKSNHLRSLKERHSSNTICPKCGGRLVVRTARKGAGAGSRFMGCGNYPRCKFTRNL